MKDNLNILMYILVHRALIPLWDRWDRMRGKGRYSL